MNRTPSPAPLAAALLALAACPGAAARQLPAMSAVDLLSLPRLSEPRLSPDGGTLVYALEEADWERNRRVSQLWLKRPGDARPARLTRGGKGASSPRFSPDGRLVAFLSEREGDEREQIYLIDLSGGEARRLARLPTEPESIAWSPDGRFVYFLAEEDKSAERKAREEAGDDAFAFEEDWRHRHLWRAAVADGTVARVAGGGFTVNEYALSRDGARMVVSRAPSPLLDAGWDGELWLADGDGTGWRRLTFNRVREGGAELSPDGARVLFIAGAGRDFEDYHDRNLFVMPAAGGEPTLLLEDSPHSVLDAAWSADGRSILLHANTGVRTDLFRVDPAGGEPVRLTSGDHALRGWSYRPESGAHVMAVDTAAGPGDAWRLRDGAMERLSFAFEHVAETWFLPRQEAVRWTGADGEPVEGVLYYPRGHRPGVRHPLLVQTHGGPRASDKLGFPAARDFVPLATARGWLVLKPNYRGSSGYGDRFLRGMVGGYFGQSHLDVMAGADHLIAAGLADGERMAKMGWSAGGHMTNKLVTFTDRFAAASSGAGASNWLSMYAQTDIRLHRGAWFGGGPWTEGAPVEEYWRQSPLREAWRASTPTLLLAGAEDRRVPAAQSVEFHRALRANGVETRLHIAPREGHGWRELRHQLFKINAEMAWIEKHALGRDYVWETAPAGADGGGG